MSYYQKLILAFVVSCLGFGASYRFMKNATTFGAESGEPIAILDLVSNEVQKKSAHKIIWQSIGEQEGLFPGESIRTSSDAEARIKFNNGTLIELEPDSVVVLSTTGKTAIDFIKGNLFVRSSGGKDGTSDVEVTSNGAKINVNNADMQIGSNGCGADVQVVRGEANVAMNGKSINVDKDKKADDKCFQFNQALFKVKTPLPNDKRFLNIEKPEFQEFEWQVVPGDFMVSIEVGTKRDALFPIKDFKAVPMTKGKLSLMLKPGLNFWRLTAKSVSDSKKVISSSVGKLTVVAESAPKLLGPSDLATVVLTPDKPQIDFRWANPSKLEKQLLEVSSDKDFKTPILVQEVETQTAYFADLTTEGTFYWRVSGFRTGDSRVQLVSKAQSFILKTRYELNPPDLKLPLTKASIPFEQVNKSGVFLTWNEVPGIKTYQVVIKSSDPSVPLIDKTVSDQQQFRLTGVKPGAYSWSVFSIDEKGERSKESIARSFTVMELPKIIISSKYNGDIYQYTTPKPSLSVAWESVSKAAKYKLTLKNPMTEKEEVIESVRPFNERELLQDGNYSAVVEAFDSLDKIIARSDVKNLRVEPKPLLPAPEFSEALPQQIRAAKNGAAIIEVKPVSGARQYIVQIKTESGALTKEEKVSGSKFVLKNLMPGLFQLTVSSVDEFGRKGPESVKRGLNVPDVSDLKGPKFKGVKVR